MLETVADVKQAYWAVVAARREFEVRCGNVTLAEQQRSATQMRIDANTAAVSDLAQPAAEVERRRRPAVGSGKRVRAGWFRLA